MSFDPPTATDLPLIPALLSGEPTGPQPGQWWADPNGCRWQVITGMSRVKSDPAFMALCYAEDGRTAVVAFGCFRDGTLTRCEDQS